MQDAIFYVAAGETLGVVRDYANAKNVSAPTLVRGVSARLRMRIFARKEGPEPYPMDALADIVRWQWAMDSDFNEATSYKLQANNASITLSEVQDDIDGDEFTYTEVSIPIPDTNSEELAAWIGTDKSKGGLHGELVGYDASGAEIFVLQVENFTLRNRITSLGAPTPVSADYLTASQVAAMIAAGLECQFSADGESWHAVQQPGDAFLRMRVRNSGGVWSDAFRLLAGPKGEPGRDAFLYVAYASDANGTGFSTTQSNSLKYRAEIHTSEEMHELSAEDFAGKWVKYLGEDGEGTGDMRKDEYDTDNDGKVDSAAQADTALAVAWDNVTGRPEGFTPTPHVHSQGDLKDPVRQTVRRESNPATLYLDSQILVNSTTVSEPMLAINFTAIRETPGGNDYTVASDDFLTWEYHVRCSSNVTSVAIGSLESSMVPVSIPDTLPLVNGHATWHVFTIRAIYKSGATGNRVLQVNYCYSYEA